MARTEFRRRDLTILVEREGDDAVVRFSAASRRKRVRLGSPHDLADSAAFLDLAARWREALPGGLGEALLPRIVLDLRDERWFPYPWESILREARLGGPPIAVVRLSTVIPRTSQIPLTLPLRFLETGPAPIGEVRKEVEGGLPGADPGRRARAVVTAEGPPPDLHGLLLAGGWRTADVLHVHRPHRLAPEGEVLTAADPDRAGTLGWLGRLADVWQTRLVVLSGFDRGCEHRDLLRVAHALAGRGGPAVLVVPEGSSSGLYAGLVEDKPLDWICRELQQGDAGSLASLVAGAGREEALRPSNIPRGLRSPAVQAALTGGEPAALRGFKPFAVGTRHMRAFAPATEFHGILTLSRDLDTLRDLARKEGIDLEARTPSSGPRHVNARLFSVRGGRPRGIPQAGARLAPGQVVHLGIQIGPRDEILQTVGPTAFLEEVLRSSPDPYVEVAVTGIDFLVLGSPVQELKVPAGAATDMLYFAVLPHPRRPPITRGVARLRFSLYHRNNLFQSFRVAVLLRGRHAPPPGEERARLAEALGVEESELPRGDAGYLTRMEYSRLPDYSAVRDLPGRALSFVVNDASGKAVVSVKGTDLFAASVDDNLPGKVEAAREALKQVSSRKSLLLPEELEYAFGEANRGDPESLKPTLRKLAEAGWDLYSTLVQGEDARRRVEDHLGESGQVVHAAHVDLAKVIPWTLVYDRPYDAERRQQDGGPVAHDTCLAAVAPDGSLRAGRCGTLPECLIPGEKPARRGDGLLLLPETVACPLRFWGFKHVVEVPAHQVPELGGSPSPPAGRIMAGRPVRVVAALNSALPLAQTHLARLEEGMRKVSASLDPGPVYDRDDLLDRLRTLEPDVVYLYCHARKREGASPAYLEFRRSDGSPGRITVAQLDGKPWSHAPLVFLNGCGTAGLTPTAPSELILRLVRQRRAGGVVGAEVEVWEALAGEMALLFLERFLDPDAPLPAGQALLQARRALLSKNNPLGLVYTLYAPAELRLS